MHNNSLLLFDKYAAHKFLANPNAKVLEIGPDNTPSTYQKRVNWQGQWDTLDIHPYCKPTILSKNAYQFPILSKTYDIVFSAQVIEHVPYIWKWLPELSRVCKTGGLLITINPVSWEYHTAPVDCWRIYPDGMQALYDYAGVNTNLSVFEAIDPDMPDVTDTITIGTIR